MYTGRGKYYFADPDTEKWIPLGADLTTALAQYAKLRGPNPLHSMADLFDRYVLEVLPHKAARTQHDQLHQMPKLRAAFGHLLPGELTPRLVIRYRNARAQRSKTQTNQELALLSHVCAVAIEWEAMEWNPCRDVKKYRLKPRDAYVEDALYLAAYRKAGERARAFMDLALLTSQREGDLRRLAEKDLDKEGMAFRQGKTGKRLIVIWSPALRAVVARARRIEPHGSTLISTRDGKPYGQSAFSSMWQRLMARLDREQRFRFNDLRAKSASDDSLAAATERLGHADPRLTQRVYRRRPARVPPGYIGRGRRILDAKPPRSSGKTARKSAK